MNNRVRAAVSAVIVTVAVLAGVQQYRFARYVAETLPRDAAQEQCSQTRATIIGIILQARAQNEAVEADRDRIALDIARREAAGQPVTEELKQRRVEALERATAARQDMLDIVDANPIPEC